MQHPRNSKQRATQTAPLAFFRAGGAFAAAGPFKPDPDGWIQLARPGEVEAELELPGAPAPVPFIEVLDAKAAQDVAAAFAAAKAAGGASWPGLLLDFDHFSMDVGKDSRAAGWIEDVEARGAGELWGRVRFSAAGRAAVEGGDYRLVSPVLLHPPRAYQPGERVRPTSLHSAALTNNPRIKGMLPVSHRQPGSAGDHRTSSTTHTMDPQLIALLGLPDDADAGAVAEAVQALLDKIATLEGAAATATAEADLEAAGVPAEMRDKWRPLLVAHREQTLPLLAAFSEAAKAKAKPPAPPAYKPLDRSREASPAARHRADAPAAAEAHAAKVANRAREIQASGAQAGQPVSYNRAFSLAQQELG